VDADHSFLSPRGPLGELRAHDVETVVSKPGAVGVEPVLSIAIPTFRRPALLREALDSAVRQAGTRPFEILVVDNDATPEIASQVDAVIRAFDFPGLVLYRNRHNVGMFGNWNRCLQLARAPWVSILNDDDLIRPDFVDTVCRLIDTRPEVDLVETGYDVWDRRVAGPDGGAPERPAATRASVGEPRELDWREVVLGNRRAGSLGIAYRASLARALGGFDADEFPTADYGFNVRLLARARVALATDATLAIYRVQENESLKAETLQGFIRNDFLLRREAAIRMSHPALMRTYARMAAVAQWRSLEQAWGVSIPVDALGAGIGIRFPRGAMGRFLARASAGLLRRMLRSLR
jgi:glycosyltransferase involved in cell wall biosynthesis